MTYAILYIAVLVPFLAIDALWLMKVAGPMFRRRLGAIMLEDPRMGVAAGFYALYCLGVVHFVAAPADGDVLRALINGALFGFFCYGTYEATNLATLKGWTWSLALTDTAWGAALTGFSAALAVWLVG